MQFNKYIWDLYKHSETGKKAIETWIPSADFPESEFALDTDKSIFKKFLNSKNNYIAGEGKINWYRFLADYFTKKDNFTRNNYHKSYRHWILEGINLGNQEIIKSNNYQLWVVDISLISRVLYGLYPDNFFPYVFDDFNLLNKIAIEFEIPLPKIPLKKDWEKRAFYYPELCEALNEFKSLHGFSPQELCAFLYDFAPNNIGNQENDEIPFPSKAWFVGGNKVDFEYLDNAGKNSRSHWQGNPDARIGDIIVMYCLSPRSYIHSIWRVFEDGFVDPFFYYYNMIKICDPILIDKKIAKRELEENAIWSKNPLVRKNLQGINGYPIQYSEYLEILSMLESKGVNTQDYPVIQKTNRLEAAELYDERDVEIKLIEPFLKLIEYTPDDWKRQMPVKIGTGVRYYPDYCFAAIANRGEETAKMVLEAKFEIKTQKALREAYFQAKSYALRLQADKFVIASKEGIWIYEPDNSTYKFEKYQHYNWLEIENPDVLYKLKMTIGKAGLCIN
ncbi:MAG TPA: hypothetical protein VE912_08970 [Bacteroidales bacterium]|nr:hypothetical protein [Bacteroidales bacterium]